MVGVKKYVQWWSTGPFWTCPHRSLKKILKWRSPCSGLISSWRQQTKLRVSRWKVHLVPRTRIGSGSFNYYWVQILFYQFSMLILTYSDESCSLVTTSLVEVSHCLMFCWLTVCFKFFCIFIFVIFWFCCFLSDLKEAGGFSRIQKWPIESRGAREQSAPFLIQERTQKEPPNQLQPCESSPNLMHFNPF